MPLPDISNVILMIFLIVAGLPLLLVAFVYLGGPLFVMFAIKVRMNPTIETFDPRVPDIL